MAGTERRSGVDLKAILAPAATVAVVAFVVLQIKEYVDAGRFDTSGTMTDALLVAGGMLVFGIVRHFVPAPRTS